MSKTSAILAPEKPDSTRQNAKSYCTYQLDIFITHKNTQSNYWKKKTQFQCNQIQHNKNSTYASLRVRRRRLRHSGSPHTTYLVLDGQGAQILRHRKNSFGKRQKSKGKRLTSVFAAIEQINKLWTHKRHNTSEKKKLGKQPLRGI